MEGKVFKSRLINKREIANNIFEFYIDANNDLKNSKAGQFIHIKCGDSIFLRRPISICELNKDTLRFIFEVRGKGTEELSKFIAGDYIDIMGPLGQGFSVKKYKNPVVIGGGIGIYPLLFLSKEINPIAILGFRNKDVVTLIDDFESACKKVYISTDDGSLGKKGVVTDILLTLIKNEEIDAIFACGPLPMLKAIKKISNDYNIFTEVSMEQRMGCGVGACLCCAVKTTDENKDRIYKHVCSDGPVFNINEVIL